MSDNKRKREADELIDVVKQRLAVICKPSAPPRPAREQIEFAVSTEIARSFVFSDFQTIDGPPPSKSNSTHPAVMLVSATLESAVTGKVYLISIKDFTGNRVKTTLSLTGMKNYEKYTTENLSDDQVLMFDLNSEDYDFPSRRRFLPFSSGLSARINGNHFEATRAYRVLRDALVDAASSYIDEMSDARDEDVDDKITTPTETLRVYIHANHE